MKTTLLLLSLLALKLAFTQTPPNYNEQLVPMTEIPDPLATFDGQPIQSTSDWETIGRPEVLDFFEKNVYGTAPGAPDSQTFTILEQATGVLEGQATRKQVRVTIGQGSKTLYFTILLYLPKDIPAAPVFLGYNFYGNHTVHPDPEILIPTAWSMNDDTIGVTDNRPAAVSRGKRSNRWDIDAMLAAGYGLATIYYGEIDPDKDDFTDGAHALFNDTSQTRGDSDWGSIAAWAWGLSRAMDYLVTDDGVDASRVIVFGHSRLGKAALWAGATDSRFAAVISNDSGCGGAALSKRRFGETVSAINTTFPHWFSRNFRRYNENEDALPADQHQLLALIAPRPLYVASAVEDTWADPRGEYLAAHYASPVFALYGKKGMDSPEMPPLNTPFSGTVAYHIRSGGHDVTPYDWEQFILWADKQLPSGN